jgi:hypothetical protein
VHTSPLLMSANTIGALLVRCGTRLGMCYILGFQMNMRSVFVKLVLAISMALIVPWLWAQDGLEGALPRVNSGSPLSLTSQFAKTLAVADFDNDHKPDGAVLVESARLYYQNTYRIELHLSAGRNSELTVESTEITLSITARDVNNDGATDIVIEQPMTGRRLSVWLNDGHGGFHKGRLEDFPITGNPEGKRVEWPFPSADFPAACLSPQRSTEFGILASRCLPRRAPPTISLKAVLPVASPASAIFSPSSSRAPPLS